MNNQLINDRVDDVVADKVTSLLDKDLQNADKLQLNPTHNDGNPLCPPATASRLSCCSAKGELWLRLIVRHTASGCKGLQAVRVDTS